MTITLVDRLSEVKAVPVVVVDDPLVASGLGDALVGGGLPCAEITLRTPSADAVIKKLTARGDMVVGAGTVLSVADVDRAAQAGAQFLVSPGLNLAVVARARTLGIPVFPGIATASELQSAVNEGLEYVKLFPAELIGGTQMIDALSGPFPAVKFMPSGGLTLEKAASYLTKSNVFCIGGSWMVRRSWLKDRDFGSISQSARETVAATSAVMPRG